jgi:hypothetical protein
MQAGGLLAWRCFTAAEIDSTHPFPQNLNVLRDDGLRVN